MYDCLTDYIRKSDSSHGGRTLHTVTIDSQCNNACNTDKRHCDQSNPLPINVDNYAPRRHRDPSADLQLLSMLIPRSHLYSARPSGVL